MHAFWYGLFAAGGMLTALVVPMHVLLNNLVAPSSYPRMVALVGNPLVKLYLFALIALALFHWAHRFRYILMDLGVMGARRQIALLTYGSAIIGTVVGAIVLTSVP